MTITLTVEEASRLLTRALLASDFPLVDLVKKLKTALQVRAVADRLSGPMPDTYGIQLEDKAGAPIIELHCQSLVRTISEMEVKASIFEPESAWAKLTGLVSSQQTVFVRTPGMHGLQLAKLVGATGYPTGRGIDVVLSFHFV